jgi:two-component system phosphate regulon sensor histidine kinase PhoR
VFVETGFLDTDFQNINSSIFASFDPGAWASPVLATSQTVLAGFPTSRLLQREGPAALSDAPELEPGLIVLFLLLFALAAFSVGRWLTHRALSRALQELTAVISQWALGRSHLEVPKIVPKPLQALSASVRELSSVVQELRTARAAEEQRWTSLLEALEEGLALVDRQAHVQWINQRFCELLGLQTPLARESLLERIRLPEFRRIFEEAQRSQSVARGVLELPTQDRQLEVCGLPLGAGESLLLLVRDRTQERKNEAVRRDFVANVSHELRTPVAALHGWTETLVEAAKEEDLPTVQKAAQKVLAQTRRLQLLLDDLLALSRLEMGLTPADFEPVAFDELVEEAVDLLDHEAGVRQVSVLVEPGPPVAFWGHRASLLRMLTNLLENAIRYNRRGGSVRLLWEVTGQELRFEIIDTGIGIPPSDLPRIFERFFRVERGRSRQEGGTGLGLSIVKHVVQAHKGRLEVESQPRVGSTFRVFLPLPTA